MSTRARLVWATSMLWCGCGALAPSPAFDLHRRDADPSERAYVAAQLGAPPPLEPSPAPRIAVVGADGVSLHDAQTGARLWHAAARPASPALLRGPLVVYAEAGKLVARDAGDGSLRFAAALGREALLGVAASAERLFVTTADVRVSGADRGARIAAIDIESGRVHWAHEVSGRLGAPAVRSGLLFVPWNYQYLCALDPRTGEELARLRSRDGVVRWVASDAAGIAFGDQDLRLLQLPEPALGGPALPFDPRALPGRPALRSSGYDTLPVPGTAESSIALHFELDPHAPPHLRDDGAYLVFFRHVLGLNPSGAPRFAQVVDTDVVAAAPTATGLLVVTRDGALRLLDGRDGRTRHEATLGLEPLAVEIEAHAVTGAEPTDPMRSLRAMLSAMALDVDSRLVPTRAFAVRQLAALPEPEVTRDLLDIYRQGSTPSGLARVVAEALRARTTGTEHLVAALAERPDFLEQTAPAPLEAVVPALEQMQATQALPLLVERMLDPQTPLRVLPLVVRAVGALGDRTALEPLRYFLHLYRADSSIAPEPQALIEAARAIARIGGDPERPSLEALAHAPGTHDAVRTAIEALWEPAAEAPAQLATADETSTEQPPAKLSAREVRKVFADHVGALRRCVLAELGRNPHLTRVRVAFVAQPDGSTRGMSLSPNGREFSACLLPKLEGLRFAPFAGERHLVDFVVGVRAFEAAQVELPAEGTPQPWWHAALARGSAEPPRGPAWWVDGNTLEAIWGASAGAGTSTSAGTGTSAGAGTGTSTSAGTGTSTSTSAGAGASTTDGSDGAQQGADEWWKPVR